jgi:hypothetical protein
MRTGGGMGCGVTVSPPAKPYEQLENSLAQEEEEEEEAEGEAEERRGERGEEEEGGCGLLCLCVKETRRSCWSALG